MAGISKLFPLSVAEENSDLVGQIVVQSIENKSNLLKEIEELQVQEIWNVGEKSKLMSMDDLFAALLNEETKPEDLKRYSRPETEYFSPLSLTISKTSSSFSQEFLQKYIYLFNDSRTFCQLLQLVSLDRTNNFHEYIQSVVDGTSEVRKEDRKFTSVSVIRSRVSEYLHHSGSGSPEKIKEILQEAPSFILPEVLQSAVDKIASMKNFNPFQSSNFTRTAIEVLRFSDEKLKLDVLSDSFASDILTFLKKDERKVDEDHFSLCLKLVPLPKIMIEQIMEVLTEIKVQKISKSSKIKKVIAGEDIDFNISKFKIPSTSGICYNLSLDSSISLKEDLFAKFLCIIEVIITDEDAEEMVSSLTRYFLSSTACSYVSSNLVTVLLRW